MELKGRRLPCRSLKIFSRPPWRGGCRVSWVGVIVVGGDVHVGIDVRTWRESFSFRFRRGLLVGSSIAPVLPARYFGGAVGGGVMVVVYGCRIGQREALKSRTTFVDGDFLSL